METNEIESGVGRRGMGKNLWSKELEAARCGRSPVDLAKNPRSRPDIAPSKPRCEGFHMQHTPTIAITFLAHVT
jgi:hypothetical protein